MATYLEFEDKIKKIEEEIIIAKTKADDHAVDILEKKLENTKKYTYLYDFVINKNIFKKETLDKWLIINQSGILAQDFFYYMKNKKFIMAFQIIIKASKINTKLPFAIINKIFRRGLKLING